VRNFEADKDDLNLQAGGRHPSAPPETRRDLYTSGQARANAQGKRGKNTSRALWPGCPLI
jgi:hypothetical protein